MAQIERPDYETITAVCDHCGSRCIFNRVADLGDPGRYSGRNVTCLNCRKEFWVVGDIINPAYDLFISGANEHFHSKRYMLCVANLAQAWELFFASFASLNYLYHPYSAGMPSAGEQEQFIQLRELLDKAIGKFTFAKLRNVLLNTILKRVHPETLQASEVAIPRITTDGFRNEPSDADIENFPDAKTQDLLNGLKNLRIGELRNNVVHHDAYRPKRTEVEHCRGPEIELLKQIERGSLVPSFNKHAVIRAQLRSW
jgi:hypothetical protein